MVTAVEKAFALISQYTGITFVKVTETTTQVGDIRIGVTTSSQLSVGVSIGTPSGTTTDSSHGDLWLAGGWNSTGSTTGDDWSAGSFGFMTLMHEIGQLLPPTE